MENEKRIPEEEGNKDDSKMSVSERRKLKRAEQAAEKKAAKDAAKSEKAEKAPQVENDANKEESSKADEEERLNPQQYYENRNSHVTNMKSKGQNPYPHKWHTNVTVEEFIAKYKDLSDGEHSENEEVSVAGRVVRVATSGQKLRFYDLKSDGVRVQVLANFRYHDENKCGGSFADVHDAIRRGDIVGFRGFPGKSKRGELSVFPREVKVLAPCLRMLPLRLLKDQETRYRQRYIDLIVNDESRKPFVLRAECVAYLRNYLSTRGFIEVETPMMNAIAGGAAARPFKTFHNDLQQDLYMRVAPELYLKMLVVGGLNKVFEIGKNFRNEGIDMTHNPEFTACEFYWAYADYYDLLDTTEHLVSSMVKHVRGSYMLTYHPDGPAGEEHVIDFTPPFKRVSMVAEIEKQSGVTLPRPLTSTETTEVLQSLIKENDLEMPRPPTTSKLLDQLCGHYIESKIVKKPVFIIDHPQIMSPLAKWHRTLPEMTERFELFVFGKELCNAYTELNDPQQQRLCFEEQAKAIKQGDDEAQPIDDGFCTALEYGLPPTGGWGLGIDRLTMFLADKNNIKEVLLFPAMRTPVAAPLDAKEIAGENI